MHRKKYPTENCTVKNTLFASNSHLHLLWPILASILRIVMKGLQKIRQTAAFPDSSYRSFPPTSLWVTAAVLRQSASPAAAVRLSRISYASLVNDPAWCLYPAGTMGPRRDHGTPPGPSGRQQGAWSAVDDPCSCSSPPAKKAQLHGHWPSELGSSWVSLTCI